jgi:hypothetical protein
MKKNLIFLSATLLMGTFAWSGNHTIVVRDTNNLEVGNSVVQIQSDSIIVKPAADVTVITVTVTDVTGEVLSEQVLPAQSDATVNVTTPSSSEGYTLELRDDTGLIYSEEL